MAGLVILGFAWELVASSKNDVVAQTQNIDNSTLKNIWMFKTV